MEAKKEKGNKEFNKENKITEFMIKDTLKKKKKVFLRQDHQKKKKLKKVWRYPRGIHSKLRHRLRGYGIIVKPGYKTPKVLRGRTIEGYKIITINNKKELEQIKKLSKEDKIAVRIASSVGKKKRIMLLEEIKKLGLKCDFNLEKQLSKINKELEERKKEKKEEEKTKKKKEEEQKEQKETKKEKEQTQEIKDQKEKEREEFERIIRSQKG
ncbi:MAG: eL32 family ribosomal protein [Candidatus Woesearchaeota archaeon]